MPSKPMTYADINPNDHWGLMAGDGPMTAYTPCPDDGSEMKCWLQGSAINYSCREGHRFEVTVLS